jgi:hypothetical protein
MSKTILAVLAALMAQPPLAHADPADAYLAELQRRGVDYSTLQSSRVSADRLPELDARLRRPHCVGDIQDRFHLKIGERSELGCRFG